METEMKDRALIIPLTLSRARIVLVEDGGFYSPEFW